MQVPAAQLQAQLQRGLKSLYTLHGDEALLLQEAADAIRTAARSQGYTERTSHTVAGAHFDWSEVLAAGGSLSLFADRQIVEIRIPSGKPGRDGSRALQEIAEAAQGNESTLTLVMLPRLDKATRTGAWFAALESFGVTVQIDPVSARPCRNGLRSAWPVRSSALPPAPRVNEPCNFLPTGSRAICWLRIRRSRNWPCCIRLVP